MATLIFGIGIPGSGKTTILQKLAEKYRFNFISIDELKIKKLGRVQDVSPEMSKEIWDEARNRMKEYLLNGYNIVFDSTFTRLEWRDNFFLHVREIPGVTIEGIFFNIPVECVLERNAKRGQSGGKLTPEAYIRESYERLHENAPSKEEDFDTLLCIDEHGAVSILKGNEDSALLQYLKDK